jgi:excisionase family DNA binding protein
MQERLKTAQEIATYLSIPLSGLYDLSHRKKIHCIRIGTRLRFRQSEIEEWLENQTIRPEGGRNEP